MAHYRPKTDRKKVFEKLEARLGRGKAIVAIARRLLVAVWHVLKKEEVDQHAIPMDVARSFFGHAYRVGVRNLPGGISAKDFTRQQLDRLKIGIDDALAKSVHERDTGWTGFDRYSGCGEMRVVGTGL